MTRFLPSSMLATITSKNSSPILLMDINKTDSVAAYYSSSDYINFSQPRFIRVYSSDYSAYAQYQVTVNVQMCIRDRLSRLSSSLQMHSVYCHQYLS